MPAKAGIYQFNNNIYKAYTEVLKLNFNGAIAYIKTENKENPENLVPVYLLNYIDFLTLIISEDENLFENLKPNKNIRLSALEKGSPASPYHRYYQAEIHLQWAAARIKFNEYLTAAYEINKAYRLLRQNERIFPDFIPNKKSLGLINAMVGSIPDNFRWLVRIIGMSGTIDEGVSQLVHVLRTAESNKKYAYLKPETVFILAYVNLNLYNDQTLLNEIITFVVNDTKIQELTQSSALINYAVANIYMRSKTSNEIALRTFNRYSGCQSCFPFWYRHYAMGLAKLYRQDKNADKHFYTYINNFEGMNYIKAAYQKLAWHHFLNNDAAAYHKYMALVKSEGQQNTDEDKQALSEAETNEIPNYYLLKARLLFDGGYYDRALSTLLTANKNKAFETFKEALEFTYRMGRIYHEMKNYKQAMDFYKLTIEMGQDHKFYYAANASLQMGLIYENQNNFNKAKHYFEWAQNMKNTQYKNSIDQKAKAGLNRIK